VAPRRAACRARPGGDEIQALRQSRARLILGSSAVAGALLLGAYGAVTADRLGWLLGVLGASAVLVLSAALALRAPGLITPALVLLGGEFAGLFLVREQTVDVRAPLYGVGIFLVAELSFAALELRAGKPEAGLVPRRAALLAALALGGVLAGALVIAAATVPLDGGVALEALGVAAAVGSLLLLGRLAARPR
jgi:hypothetical protein